MLATAMADGSVQLWLSDHVYRGDTLQCSFSHSVDCKGALECPLLLRWDAHSSSLLCCCQDSHSFFLWNVLAVIADDIDAGQICCCSNYDQSFVVVFADFLLRTIPTCSDMLISCTRENHIFVCDMENNLLFTFAGGAEECVTAAVLLPTLGRHSPVAGKTQGQNQPLVWSTRGQFAPQPPSLSSSSPSTINLGSSPTHCPIEHSLLVSNSRSNEITLFHVRVSYGDSNDNHAFEIAPISRLLVGSPVVSLAGYFSHQNHTPGSDAPLAFVTLFGGKMDTIFLSSEV